jgi:hypothetical protein
MLARALPVALLLAGLGLVALALPRTIAGLRLVPATPVVESLRRGERVTEPYLAATTEAQAGSLAWAADAQAWADLGLVQWELALRAGLGSEAGQARLATAALATDRALALAPSLGLVWARRAQIELVRNGLTPAFEDSLALSLATAPFDPTVLWPRLELALIAWPVLSEATRMRVAPQIAAAAIQDPGRLAELALRRFALGPVRAALRAAPSQREAFEQALALRR